MNGELGVVCEEVVIACFKSTVWQTSAEIQEYKRFLSSGQKLNHVLQIMNQTCCHCAIWLCKIRLHLEVMCYSYTVAQEVMSSLSYCRFTHTGFNF